MKKQLLIFLLLLTGICSQSQAQQTNDLPDSSNKAFNEPLLFAPGIIPSTAKNNLDAAFSPDNNTVCIGQLSGDQPMSIMIAHRAGSQWSALQTAPFSGTYVDLEPTFDPNGKYLVFSSSRPVSAGGVSIDGHYNGKFYPGKGGNLWKVAVTKTGWGAPEVLPTVINADSSVFSPAVAGDGSLYFMRADNGGIFHIYRSQMDNGNYQTPVPASFTVSDHGDFDPAVAPDESFIIFSSGRAPAPHVTDLFIAFRTANGIWGEPIDLRSVLSANVYGVEARLSPDCQTLYFTNQRNAAGEKVKNESFIWKVDIGGLLKAHGINISRLKKSL